MYNEHKTSWGRKTNSTVRLTQGFSSLQRHSSKINSVFFFFNWKPLKVTEVKVKLDHLIRTVQKKTLKRVKIYTNYRDMHNRSDWTAQTWFHIVTTAACIRKTDFMSTVMDCAHALWSQITLLLFIHSCLAYALKLHSTGVSRTTFRDNMSRLKNDKHKPYSQRVTDKTVIN